MEPQYVILNVEDIHKINFDEVLETSKDTLAYSLDGSRTYVSWYGSEVPPCIYDLTTKSEIMTYDTFIGHIHLGGWLSTIK